MIYEFAPPQAREGKAGCESCLADPLMAALRFDLKAVDSTDMAALGLLLGLCEHGHALNKRVCRAGCALGAAKHHD